MSSDIAHARLQKLDNQDTLEAARRREYDCFSCRVMGASAFGALGVYSYISGHRGLSQREAEIIKSGAKIKMPARRLGVTATSVVLVGLGLYRAFV